MGLKANSINISDDFETNEQLTEADKQMVRDMIEDFDHDRKVVCRSVFRTIEFQDLYYSQTKFVRDSDENNNDTEKIE